MNQNDNLCACTIGFLFGCFAETNSKSNPYQDVKNVSIVAFRDLCLMKIFNYNNPCYMLDKS